MAAIDILRTREAISKLPREQVLADLRNAAEYVRNLPAANGKLAIAGFCWGGSGPTRAAGPRSQAVDA